MYLTHNNETKNHYRAPASAEASLSHGRMPNPKTSRFSRRDWQRMVAEMID